MVAGRHSEKGTALLEVIIALTILTVAALSTVAWVNQAADAFTRTSAAAAETEAASEYLDRIALWTSEDLDRHLGARKQGNWTVTVERPTAPLYVVTITDAANARTILSTTLYRPEVKRVAS
jgi:type II secretory pathway component PulJ